MVREVFEDRFKVSKNQRRTLDKWSVGTEDGEGKDVTTEEEDNALDSDYDCDDFYY